MTSRPLPFADLLRLAIRDCKKIWKPVVLGGLLFFALEVPIQIGLAFVPNDGPVVGSQVVGIVLLFIARLLLAVVSYVYFLVLGIEQHPHVRQTFERIPALVRPVIVTWWRLFLRAYVWLPFLGLPVIIIGAALKQPIEMALGIGIFLAGLIVVFIRAPRFAFAEIILVKERKHPRQSVQASHDRTRGYWGKIVGNNILFLLTLMLCFAALSACIMLSHFLVIWAANQGGFLILLSIVGALVMIAAGSALLIFMLFSQVIGRTFFLHLHETIAAHPRKN